MQELEKESPDFNLLGLNCTGDASESGLIKCVELLRSVEEYNQANPKLHEIKVDVPQAQCLPAVPVACGLRRDSTACCGATELLRPPLVLRHIHPPFHPPT